MPLRTWASLFLITVVAVGLTACEGFGRQQERPYGEATVSPPLEVPPDLVGIPVDQSRAIPPGGRSSQLGMPGLGGVGGAVRTRNAEGRPVVNVYGDLGRAYERTGVVLRRMDLQVASIDPDTASYVVVYRPRGAPLPETATDSPHDTPYVEDSWLQRLVRRTGILSESRGDPREFIVRLQPAQVGTDISVLDARGRPDNSPGAEQILETLYEQLR